MKNYFPFTDYDFYAYLTSGALLLAVLDFTFNNGDLVSKSDWSFVQIVIAIASAYITGHLVATLSHLLIESFLVSRILSKPITLQLGFKKPNWIEQFLGLLVGRYYEPMPPSIQKQIIGEAKNSLNELGDEQPSSEDIFQVGYRKSFSDDGVRQRIDSFLNQYGFCRNVTFVGIASSALFISMIIENGTSLHKMFLIISLLVTIVMFVRYLKFYASFQAEVIKILLK